MLSIFNDRNRTIAGKDVKTMSSFHGRLGFQDYNSKFSTEFITNWNGQKSWRTLFAFMQLSSSIQLILKTLGPTTWIHASLQGNAYAARPAQSFQWLLFTLSPQNGFRWKRASTRRTIYVKSSEAFQSLFKFPHHHQATTMQPGSEPRYSFAELECNQFNLIEMFDRVRCSVTFLSEIKKFAANRIHCFRTAQSIYVRSLGNHIWQFFQILKKMILPSIRCDSKV